MRKKKFDSDLEFDLWSEKKELDRTLNEYFKTEFKKEVMEGGNNKSY